MHPVTAAHIEFPATGPQSVGIVDRLARSARNTWDEGTSGKVKVLAIAFFASLLILTLPFVTYILGRASQLKEQDAVTAQLVHAHGLVSTQDRRLSHAEHRLHSAHQHLAILSQAIHEKDAQIAHLMGNLHQLVAENQQHAINTHQLQQMVIQIQAQIQPLIDERSFLTSALLLAQQEQATRPEERAQQIPQETPLDDGSIPARFDVAEDQDTVVRSDPADANRSAYGGRPRHH